MLKHPMWQRKRLEARSITVKYVEPQDGFCSKESSTLELPSRNSSIEPFLSVIRTEEKPSSRR